MHRVDGPGAGPSGEFVEGDPGLGVAATTVTGDWLNAVQEEIATVIEDEGIVLNKALDDQLKTAIQQMIDAGIATVNPTIPIGGVIEFGGTVAPAGGWLLCDGAAVSRATYAALFAVIGVAYGIGDGVNTFNVPNMKGRFPLGKAVSGTGSVLGVTGGTIDHVHNVAVTVNANTQNKDITDGGDVAALSTHAHTTSVSETSTNPPFQTFNFIIKT